MKKKIKSIKNCEKAKIAKEQLKEFKGGLQILNEVEFDSNWQK